jgi:hypothetical protein
VVLVVRVKEKASVRGVGGGRSRDEVSGFVLLHNPEEARFGRKTGVFVLRQVARRPSKSWRTAALTQGGRNGNHAQDNHCHEVFGEGE